MRQNVVVGGLKLYTFSPLIRHVLKEQRTVILMSCSIRLLSMNQVAVKLRFLTKRGKARKDRVGGLKAEKKGLEAQLESAKVGCPCVCFSHSASCFFLARRRAVLGRVAGALTRCLFCWVGSVPRLVVERPPELTLVMFFHVRFRDGAWFSPTLLRRAFRFTHQYSSLVLAAVQRSAARDPPSLAPGGAVAARAENSRPPCRPRGDQVGLSSEARGGARHRGGCKEGQA